jgi:hypothetical protein
MVTKTGYLSLVKIILRDTKSSSIFYNKHYFTKSYYGNHILLFIANNINIIKFNDYYYYFY